MVERYQGKFPFERVPQPERGLEYYLRSTPKSGLIASRDLPYRIQAGQVEFYANYLASLTVLDPNRSEFAGQTTLQNGFLDSPILPASGENEIPLENFQSEGVALVHTHSHPGNFSFAVPAIVEQGKGSYSDLHTFLTTEVPISVVATPTDQNYLLIRTQETTLQSERSVSTAINELHKRSDFDTLLDIKRPYTQVLYRRKATSREINELLQGAEESLGGSFNDYCQRFITTIQLAEYFHFGFYYSNKDGDYAQLTRENIYQFVEDRWNSALLNAGYKEFLDSHQEFDF